tara:strand:+ start:936 stop:1241 length:306 start_codon:yes stop_codon:yes gene_type:complete
MFKATVVNPIDFREFEKKFQKLIKDVGNETIKVARAETPIRSGRARNNWTKQTTRQGFQVENTVPYIGVLDKGSSKQAPRGITKPTVKKVTGYIRTRRLSR